MLQRFDFSKSDKRSSADTDVCIEDSKDGARSDRCAAGYNQRRKIAAVGPNKSLRIAIIRSSDIRADAGQVGDIKRVSISTRSSR